MEHEGDATGKMDQAKTLREGLASIGKDIRELKQQFHNELKTFKDELKSEIKNEIKQEIAYLRQDIDHKLTENNEELQEQKTDITEAQARIAELEECNAGVSDMLAKVVKQTRQMQDKLTDLEARSRRNNVRIFGLPEDTEGASVAEYLGKLLKKELKLPDGTNLQIQRAHRALTRKPNPGGRDQ